MTGSSVPSSGRDRPTANPGPKFDRARCLIWSSSNVDRLDRGIVAICVIFLSCLIVDLAAPADGHDVEGLALHGDLAVPGERSRRHDIGLEGRSRRCCPLPRRCTAVPVHRIEVVSLSKLAILPATKLGVLVTLNKATAAMERAAREAESVEAGGKLRPRVQICRVRELLKGRKPTLPPVYDIISAAAARQVAAAVAKATGNTGPAVLQIFFRRQRTESHERSVADTCEQAVCDIAIIHLLAQLPTWP